MFDARHRVPVLRAGALLCAPALALLPLLLAPASAQAIIGGGPTAAAKAPWSVALAYNSARYGGDGHRRFLCGGTLIAPTLVLTAAHCLHRTPFRRLGFAQGPHIEAIVGRTQLSAGDGQAVGVADVHYLTRRGGRLVFVTGGGRPLFERRHAHYDVALVRLVGPAAATPIRLASRREARLWRPGATGTVTGWGWSRRPLRKVSDQLRALRMRRLGDGTCAARTPTWRGAIKLCASGVRGGATCRGDSGGAFAVRAGRGWRLAGIVNYGMNSSKRTGCSGGPTTFARVSSDPLRTLIARKARQLGAGDVVGR